jgi:hypothetical protein
LHAGVGLAIALALKASLRDSLIGARPYRDARASRPFRVGAQALGGVAVCVGVAAGGLAHALATAGGLIAVGPAYRF